MKHPSIRLYASIRIAEGVEAWSQLEALRRLNCRWGYLLPSMIKRPVLEGDGLLLFGFKPDEYAAAAR